MLFLDWEKAFDKDSQPMLINALYRLNIPDKILNVIKSFYKAPKFRIKDKEGFSKYCTQKSGIRQGCPLSLYLSILLMTVVFTDIHRRIDNKISPYIGDCFNYWELLYADDTMIMGNRARQINMDLREAEIESERYNLRLNKGKCFYIGMNGSANIHFKDGTKIANSKEVTYLGGQITENSDRNAEITSRMTKALTTCKKLKIFWKKTDASIAWKFRVYNARILAQLTYGLNTLNITTAIYNRLNAFHIPGLGLILKIEHSYYSHVTIEEIISRASLQINEVHDTNITWEQFKVDMQAQGNNLKEIELAGDIVMNRQLTLLGHLMRREPDHIMRHVAFDTHLRRPYQLYKKVGHPRCSWVDDNSPCLGIYW